MAVMSFVKKDSPPSGAGVPLAPVLAAWLVAVPFFQLFIRNKRDMTVFITKKSRCCAEVATYTSLIM